jgi:hypothetical protein
VRYWSVILLMSAATGSAASGPPIAEAAPQWEKDGRSLFLACEFKQAARACENAMARKSPIALSYLTGSAHRLPHGPKYRIRCPLRKMPARHGAASSEL